MVAQVCARQTVRWIRKSWAKAGNAEMTELAKPPSAFKHFALEHFFTQLRNADSRALLLDYDGTLAPFRIDRERSFVYPAVQTALQELLAAAHTRTIIVSGRATKDLVPLLSLTPRPEIWGSHGHERLLPNGDYILAELDREAVADLQCAYEAIVASELADYCERKPASLAVHWRGLDRDSQTRLRETVLAHWAQLTAGRHFRLLDFDGGVELCIRGHDKGAAVRTILGELPPDAAVAYLGDDTTDEDAFRAIAGKGLGILVRAEYRTTAASAWLRPPTELVEFIQRWQATLVHRVPT